MRDRRWTWGVSSLAAIALASCNGQTLPIGSNDPCDAPWTDDESTAVPAVQLRRRDTLGVRRWTACPANPSSPVVPLGFDVTGFVLFPLTESGGAYVRGPAVKGGLPYSVLEASLAVTIDGVRFKVLFRESPLGMTLIDGAVKYRFVEGG